MLHAVCVVLHCQLPLYHSAWYASRNLRANFTKLTSHCTLVMCHQVPRLCAAAGADRMVTTQLAATGQGVGRGAQGGCAVCARQYSTQRARLYVEAHGCARIPHVAAPTNVSLVLWSYYVCGACAAYMLRCCCLSHQHAEWVSETLIAAGTWKLVCAVCCVLRAVCCCCWCQVSPEGRILQLLLDPTGARVATASAATEHNGRLFLGSIMGGEGSSHL